MLKVEAFSNTTNSSDKYWGPLLERSLERSFSGSPYLENITLKAEMIALDVVDLWLIIYGEQEVVHYWEVPIQLKQSHPGVCHG